MSARDQETLDLLLVETTLDPAAGAAATTSGLTPGTFVGDWRIESVLPERGVQAMLYVARSGGNEGVLKLYQPGFRPVPGVMLAQRDGTAHHLLPLVAEGEHEGSHFEVYPRHHGTTLREVVEAGRADDAFLRGVLLPQLADALSFLHERGVIHGDLAPENVLVSKGLDEVRLADFGVALGTPAPGTLVARRGHADFSPRVFELDGKVELGAGYDYGSLGLLVAYVVLGMSPIAHLGRAEADELLRSGRAFLSLPADLGRLCVALSSPLGGAKQGGEVCARFLGNAPATAAPAPSRHASSPTALEFGLVDGQVLMASTPSEFLACLEGHWGVSRRIVGSARLRDFLAARRRGARLLRLVDDVAHEGTDAQVFMLCTGLRRMTGGAGLAPLCWLGKRYDDLIALMREAACGRAPEAERFLSGDLLVRYCKVMGLGDPIVAEARRLVGSSDNPCEVARSAVEVFTGTGRDLVIDGHIVADVADLVKWVSSASLERISELVEGDVLRGWLYRRGLDDVYREVDSVS